MSTNSCWNVSEPVKPSYAERSVVPYTVIDEILRTGSNQKDSVFRLVHNCMIEQSGQDRVDFVRDEYKIGGKGLEINGVRYAVWFDKSGMLIALGDTIRNTLMRTQLSWGGVSERIHQLLLQGEYAEQNVLDGARTNAVRELATALAYMARDMSEEAEGIMFDNSATLLPRIFPDIVDEMMKLIMTPGFPERFVAKLKWLNEAYAQDKSLLRFPLYAPKKMLPRFERIVKPYCKYRAKDGFAMNCFPTFLTQDEVDAYLIASAPYSDGKRSIYSFFCSHDGVSKRADYLKSFYGTGGRYPAVPYTDDSGMSHSAKGITFERKTLTADAIRVELS